MSRATYAVPSRKRRKRVLERAKGFYGSSSKNIRTAYDAVDKALVHSYRSRKQKKQQYRALWVVRINAACRALNTNYSQFMNGLKKAGSPAQWLQMMEQIVEKNGQGRNMDNYSAIAVWIE